MSRVQKTKLAIDLVMTVLLLLVMGYMVTGEQAHEWLGMGMFLLFFAHNWLNRKWYYSLWKGTYSGMRLLGTVVNLALAVTMVLMLYSSIILSNYVFGFLDIHGSMSLARNIHLAGSYWAFLLMSVHLGLHWGMLTNVFQKMGFWRKEEKQTGKQTLLLRILALAVAFYGAWAFWKNGLLSYMLLQNLFVFFDYEQPAVLFFFEYIAMMELWACLAYYLSKLLKRAAAGRGR